MRSDARVRAMFLRCASLVFDLRSAQLADMPFWIEPWILTTCASRREPVSDFGESFHGYFSMKFWRKRPCGCSYLAERRRRVVFGSGLRSTL
jgi:hypothetical protein